MPIVKNEELILRIKDSDFSDFAGYYHTSSDHRECNEVLNAYIELYKTTPQLKYFHIECKKDFCMHTLAYIINRVNEKYFIQTEPDDNVQKNKYWLCFYKGDKEKNG